MSYLVNPFLVVPLLFVMNFVSAEYAHADNFKPLPMKTCDVLYSNAFSYYGEMDASYHVSDYNLAYIVANFLANCDDEQGYLMLGQLYENGFGTRQDYREAIKYYRKAAQKDNAIARLDLARLYATGKGVLQDYVKAHAWVNLSEVDYLIPEDKDKRNSLLKYLTERMTPTQMEEAQKLASKCTAAELVNCGL